MASLMDDLTEFAKLREELLPFLRKALANGATAEEIYKKAQSLAAARAVSIAATEVDSGKALAAIRDILDRSGGKAQERKVVEHKFSDLTDQELDAMLLSEAEELHDAEEETSEDESGTTSDSGTLQ